MTALLLDTSEVWVCLRSSLSGKCLPVTTLILPSSSFVWKDMLRLWQEKQCCNPSVMFQTSSPYQWLITPNSKTYRSIRNVNILPAIEGDPGFPCLLCARRALMVNLLAWLCGEAIMDLLSWPEVFVADYVIKSIIISVWAPLLLCFIFFFLCSWAERRVGTDAEQLCSRWHDGNIPGSRTWIQ